MMSKWEALASLTVTISLFLLAVRIYLGKQK